MDEDINEEFIRENAILNTEQIIEVLNKVNKILEKESNLIEIPPSKLYFLGDTHGNLELSIHAIKHIYPAEYSTHTRFDKIIFLGDFVDRGLYSLENVNFLMSMKSKYPDRIILIRGNHETEEISRRYGFYEAVLRNYNPEVFKLYIKIFSELPLAILTWNKIFAVHGGIPEGLENLGDINGLDNEVDPTDRIIFQILWNDPIEREGWFYNNFRGKYSRRFGRKATNYFMEKHGIKLILRAHEPLRKGFKTYFNKKLISLDSSKGIRNKNVYKVFIVEKTGEWRIDEVHDFENLNLYKILYRKPKDRDKKNQNILN
ncbi:MAG: metallophosphoesterase [Promethearchaeota archaeon]